MNQPVVSVVVPVYNERETLEPLCHQVAAVLKPLVADYELIFIDDGSRDGSVEAIRRRCAADRHVKLIGFSVNQGKSAALDYGFQVARGQVLITMDADLQDDPLEIPRFLDKIEAGYDLVSGWKSVRHDPWHKTLPSRLFNFVVAKSTGLSLHDFNCGFKAYSRRIYPHLNIYGELHRFIPVLAKDLGAGITEIAVRHHARRFGASKYGLGRLPKGFLDLTTVLFLSRYLKRPLHFFGGLGLVSTLLGGLGILYLVCLWFAGLRPIGNRPLLMFSVLLTILGVQMFSLGIIAELLIKFNQRVIEPSIRWRIGFDDAPDVALMKADGA